MKEIKSSRLLKVFLVAYGAVYIAMLVQSLLPTEEIGSDIVGAIICLLVYFIGVGLAWFNKKAAGIILMIQYFMIWILAYTVWHQAGLALALTLPVLIMGAFLYRNWYVENTEKYRTNPNARILLLDVLLLNYSVIYLFVILYSFIQKFSSIQFFKDNPIHQLYEKISYLSATGFLLVLAILVYIAGLVVLKKNRLISGVLFVVWYAIVVVLTFTSPAFSRTGPWIAFGVMILINGILYIKDYLELKKALADAN